MFFLNIVHPAMTTYAQLGIIKISMQINHTVGGTLYSNRSLSAAEWFIPILLRE